jgi:hypothetical protein
MAIDDEVAKFVIKTYLERCKFKHTLAFFQWRSLNYKAKDEDLKEIFNSRLGHLIDAIRNGNKKGKFNKGLAKLKTVIKPNEEEE